MRNQGTISKKIMIRMGFVMLTMVASLCVCYGYLTYNIRNQITTVASHAMDTFANELENHLRYLSDGLEQILYHSELLQNYGIFEDRELYYASMEVADLLNEKILYVNSPCAYFVANPGQNMIVLRGSSQISTAQSGELEKRLKEVFLKEEGIKGNRWNLAVLGETPCLLKYYHIGDAYAGTLLLPETMIESGIRDSADSINGYILYDRENGKQIYYGTIPDGLEEKRWTEAVGSGQIEDKKGKYILTFRMIGDEKLCLANTMLLSGGMYQMTNIQWMILLLLILAILLLSATSIYLSREIIMPVNALMETTQDVRAGEWDKRAAFTAGTKEFMELRDSFNIMMEEIKNLKIKSYEDAMARQRAELKYLQMQIRPHFYQNALTTIHSLTYQNKTEEIRCFIEALSNHLRYTIRSGVILVPLQEELDRVRDYVKMQEIRFKDSVFFMPFISEQAMWCRVPQFLILTFIENAFKHALDLEQLLSIYVKADIGGQRSRLYIMIEDTGKGFPENIIETINNGTYEENADGSHMGIINVKKTLELFYGKDYSLKLSNGEYAGAHIEIALPLCQEEKQ